MNKFCLVIGLALMPLSSAFAVSFSGKLNCHTGMGGGFSLSIDQDSDKWTLIATNGTEHQLPRSEILLKKLGSKYQVAFNSNNPTQFYSCTRQ